MFIMSPAILPPDPPPIVEAAPAESSSPQAPTIASSGGTSPIITAAMGALAGSIPGTAAAMWIFFASKRHDRDLEERREKHDNALEQKTATRESNTEARQRAQRLYDSFENATAQYLDTEFTLMRRIDDTKGLQPFGSLSGVPTTAPTKVLIAVDALYNYFFFIENFYKLGSKETRITLEQIQDVILPLMNAAGGPSSITPVQLFDVQAVISSKHEELREATRKRSESLAQMAGYKVQAID